MCATTRLTPTLSKLTLLHQCNNLGDLCALLNEATYFGTKSCSWLKRGILCKSLVKEKLVVILLAFPLVVYVTKGIAISALAHFASHLDLRVTCLDNNVPSLHTYIVVVRSIIYHT
jgi:hypothetical protein